MGGPANKDRRNAHQQRVRERGQRPVLIWVPDVRSPAFLAEARRQSELVARSPHADKDMAFVEALSANACGPWED